MLWIICSLLIRLSVSIPWNEYWALIDLYESTNGDEWYNNTNWFFVTESQQYTYDNLTFSNYNNSQLKNEICSNFTPYGISCAGNHITGISFPGNNLVGRLPPSIANLSYLSSLVLYNNTYLSGVLNSDIYLHWNFMALLIISEVNITFYLDSVYEKSICQMYYLTAFILNNIQNVIGELSECIGFLPELMLFCIINLYSSFDREYYHVTGSLPTSLFQNATNLEILTLAYVNLTEPELPNEMNLYSLQMIILESINLVGVIPDSICSMAMLETPAIDYFSVVFTYNNLTGTIPKCLFERLYSYEDGPWILGLGHNQLIGTLPSSINIEYSNDSNSSCYSPNLGLTGNNIRGELPSWITNCTFCKWSWCFFFAFLCILALLLYISHFSCYVY